MLKEERHNTIVEMCRARGTVTVREIADILGVSDMTVRRDLMELSDEGRIARVRINNGADHFDHRTFEHHHVRCERCGRVDDVLLEPRGREVDEAAERASGWRISGHTVQFDGVCPECQKVQAPPAE